MIMDEGPDGPNETQKEFIKKYNSLELKNLGFLTYLENFPFMIY